MVFQPSTQDLCFLPLERRTKWLVLQDHEWTQVGSTENTSSLHSDDTMSWRQAEVIRSCGPCWRHLAFAWSRVVYFETWLHYHSSRCVGRYAKMTKPHWYFKRLKFKAYMKTTCVLHSYLSLHWWTTSCPLHENINMGPMGAGFLSTLRRFLGLPTSGTSASGFDSKPWPVGKKNINIVTIPTDIKGSLICIITTPEGLLTLNMIDVVSLVTLLVSWSSRPDCP